MYAVPPSPNVQWNPLRVRPAAALEAAGLQVIVPGARAVAGFTVKLAVGAVEGDVGGVTVTVIVFVAVPSVLSEAMIRRTTL